MMPVRSVSELSERVATCELCDASRGEVIAQTEDWRLILVDDVQYPGFCRVVWNQHVKEMTDLSEQDRDVLMSVVWKVELVLREVMQPHKVNVASFGNVVPHLHWHIIPRYQDDAHFPSPIWAQPKPEWADTSARRALLPQLRTALIARLR